MINKGGNTLITLSFNKLEEAYIMVYENARELLEESNILFKHKRFARSYTLAQIAHEELAKLPIIYKEAIKSLDKEKHDWNDFYKRLRSHESKNNQNFATHQTFAKLSKGNVINLSNEEKKKHLKDVNQLKNESLYADIKNNQFTKPSNEIDELMAKAHLELVGKLLYIYSGRNYHIKGNIRKFLERKNYKLYREALKEQALIKETEQD